MRTFRNGPKTVLVGQFERQRYAVEEATRELFERDVARRAGCTLRLVDNGDEAIAHHRAELGVTRRGVRLQLEHELGRVRADESTEGNLDAIEYLGSATWMVHGLSGADEGLAQTMHDALVAGQKNGPLIREQRVDVRLRDTSALCDRGGRRRVVAVGGELDDRRREDVFAARFGRAAGGLSHMFIIDPSIITRARFSRWLPLLAKARRVSRARQRCGRQQDDSLEDDAHVIRTTLRPCRHHRGDLDTATTFFVTLGLEVEGTRTFVEGEFLDTVIGIADARTEIVMLRPPDGGTRLELSSFVRPDLEPGSPAAMANQLGLRNVAFEVDDLQAAIDRLAADGYELVGGIGQYEHIWRMAYVRGPEGIIVSLAEPAQASPGVEAIARLSPPHCVPLLTEAVASGRPRIMAKDSAESLDCAWVSRHRSSVLLPMLDCTPLLSGAPLDEQSATRLATLLRVLADPGCLRLFSLIQAQPSR